MSSVMTSKQQRQDILRSRLFGYAILYRVREVSDGQYESVAATVGEEARALADELQLHVGQSSAAGVASSEKITSTEQQEIALSVPFGRCGISGRPLEYVRLFHAEQAWLDTLGPEGAASRAITEGETVLVEPGAFVRFRARPRPGRRVLVAFQTEDRSPLAGHATALVHAGQSVAAEAEARIEQTTSVFDLLANDSEAARSRINTVFSDMTDAVSDNIEISAAQESARTSGSYEAGGAPSLFEDAEKLLTPETIDRIRSADPDLFRFPGMFGAVTPLFTLLKSC